MQCILKTLSKCVLTKRTFSIYFYMLIKSTTFVVAVPRTPDQILCVGCDRYNVTNSHYISWAQSTCLWSGRLWLPCLAARWFRSTSTDWRGRKRYCFREYSMTCVFMWCVNQQVSKPHCGDKTPLKLFYLHNGIHIFILSRGPGKSVAPWKLVPL